MRITTSKDYYALYLSPPVFLGLFSCLTRNTMQVAKLHIWLGGVLVSFNKIQNMIGKKMFDFAEYICLSCSVLFWHCFHFPSFYSTERQSSPNKSWPWTGVVPSSWAGLSTLSSFLLPQLWSHLLLLLKLFHLLLIRQSCYSYSSSYTKFYFSFWSYSNPPPPPGLPRLSMAGTSLLQERPEGAWEGEEGGSCWPQEVVRGWRGTVQMGSVLNADFIQLNTRGSKFRIYSITMRMIHNFAIQGQILLLKCYNFSIFSLC